MSVLEIPRDSEFDFEERELRCLDVENLLELVWQLAQPESFTPWAEGRFI